ncbi:hypothetical protein SGPA1_21903 [Streptomyces misionensis JCM 4497]
MQYQPPLLQWPVDHLADRGAEQGVAGVQRRQRDIAGLAPDEGAQAREDEKVGVADEYLAGLRTGNGRLHQGEVVRGRQSLGAADQAYETVSRIHGRTLSPAPWGRGKGRRREVSEHRPHEAARRPEGHRAATWCSASGAQETRIRM